MAYSKGTQKRYREKSIQLAVIIGLVQTLKKGNV